MLLAMSDPYWHMLASSIESISLEKVGTVEVVARWRWTTHGPISILPRYLMTE